MKPAMSSSPLLCLTLLLLASSIHAVSYNVTDNLEPIRDTDGNELRFGSRNQYIVEPAKSGNGGGICPAPRTYSLLDFCTLDVVQASSRYQGGQPVVFEMNTNRESVGNFAIRFSSTPFWLPCFGTKYWRVVYDEKTNKNLVSTNGRPDEDESGFRALYVQEENAYKLLHCPSSALLPRTCTNAVASYISDDIFQTRRLYIGNDKEALLLRFRPIGPEPTSVDEEELKIKMFPSH